MSPGFLPADFCHQMMIRDEHTSRCSSQRRVYSEARLANSSGARRDAAKRAFVRGAFAGIPLQSRPFQKQHRWRRDLMRLETRRCSRFEGRMTRNSESREITRRSILLARYLRAANLFPQQHLVPAIKDRHSQLSTLLMSDLLSAHRRSHA